MVNYLSAIGFLPQGSVLYLPQDRLNLPLISAATMILDGLETAVFKSALEIDWCVCVCVCVCVCACVRACVRVFTSSS